MEIGEEDDRINAGLAIQKKKPLYYFFIYSGEKKKKELYSIELSSLGSGIISVEAERFQMSSHDTAPSSSIPARRFNS